MKLWVADAAGVFRDSVRVGEGALALGARGQTVWAAGAQRGAVYAENGEQMMDFVTPPGVARVAVGRYAYVLSGDADSVTAYDLRARAAFCAPAGAFPRDMALSGDMKTLLIAGGAAGNAILLDDTLHFLREYRFFGVVCAARMTRSGVAALCALPGDDARTALVFLRHRGAAETLAVFPGAPCGMEARGGEWLIGVTGALYRLRGRRIVGRSPAVCPRPQGGLIIDEGAGIVARAERFPREILYRGAPRDAILV